jgi:TatD DNase family protein
MIDTHCHLNFKAFKKTVPEVIARARESGIDTIIIPGTDVKTSTKAVEIAQANDGIYAAVGIHPHHVFKLLNNPQRSKGEELKEIERLIQEDKVVAVGEVGIDRHEYEDTVYGEYAVQEDFIMLQKELLIKQIEFAVKYKKSLILHNREAVADILEILEHYWNPWLEGHTVLHCCEPVESLLHFAQKNHVYMGIDGDVTYTKEKQEFLPRVPLDLLVLESDSPFLLPEPLKSERKYPNEPKNILYFSKLVADLMNVSVEDLERKTTNNAKNLFSLS